jgi:hypothetical protein
VPLKNYEIPVVLVTSLVIGFSILLLLNGNALLDGSQEITPIKSSSSAANLPQQAADDVYRASATITPTPVDVERGKDIEDVLLLYDSNQLGSFDINFCKIAEYYGLLCKMLALDSTEITDRLLRDQEGNYFKLIGISATTLLKQPVLLSEKEITTIKSAISIGGANLLVSQVNASLDTTLLSSLTDGAVTGVMRLDNSRRFWSVSDVPDIAHQFSGQMVSSTSPVSQINHALLLENSAMITTLISSKNANGSEYPVFIRWMDENGSVFVDSGEQGKSVSEQPLRQLYYNDKYFSSIMPLMFTLRYAPGDETWHRDLNCANLTIDDPTLTEPFYELSFDALLEEMETHNFHTTIAIRPVLWQKFDIEVIKLFKLHPDRYSLVQHGNNHDGYEFYKYSLGKNDPKNNPELRARPLAEQESDIIEGWARLSEMQEALDISIDQVMIFPYGISPEPTLGLLKKYNYLATVSEQNIPLDATSSSSWDYGMYPAILDYENFPIVTRRHPGAYLPFKPDSQSFLFDLFLGKPALFYSHARDEIFAEGITGFNVVADQVNKIRPVVEWCSLGYILTHLYLEKTNDDGSTSVVMYTRYLSLTNETDRERVYHVTKQETLNASSISLTVNGRQYPYYVQDQLLNLDIRIPSQTTVEINIQYHD